jgi:hypothetical protein
LGPQIRKSQQIIETHGSQIRKWSHLLKARKPKKIKVRKFVDLRFAELIYGPLTFAKLT